MLFNEQGSSLISRPWFYTFHGVLSKSSAFTIGTSAWSESTKNKRKAAATALNRPAVQSYMPIIRQESLDAIARILKDGDAGNKGIVPYSYFQRLALNTSFQVNYGFRMGERDDGLFEEISEVIAKVASYVSVDVIIDSCACVRLLALSLSLPQQGSCRDRFITGLRSHHALHARKR